jgi:hypothetical protein
MDNGHATNLFCKMCEVHFKAFNDNKNSIPCSPTQQRLWVFENYIAILSNIIKIPSHGHLAKISCPFSP